MFDLMKPKKIRRTSERRRDESQDFPAKKRAQRLTPMGTRRTDRQFLRSSWAV